MKAKWIPTPLVVNRKRPTVAPIKPPGRFRSVYVGVVIAGTVARWFWTRITRPNDSVAKALLLRRMLERLGGVWVKVGQLLGLRRDLFSREFCDILSELQDRATAFDFEYSRATIEDDLGVPIEAIFSEFEEAPFAAASIGQIHRAVLRREGVQVAVKIRRPTIAATMRADIRLVEFIGNLALRTGFLPSFRWLDFTRELDRTLSEELDYRFEATGIRDMRRNLKRHGVYAPKVYRKYLSERILVMEFVRGALMSDVLRLREEDPKRLRRWMAENQIDDKKVGHTLLVSAIRQLYEDNYFHGDLHPGNIILLRKSKVALIDFGSVGWLDAAFLSQYDDFQRALSEQQYGKAADLFLLLGPELPPTGTEDCKAELATFMRDWALRSRTPKMPFSQKSMGHCYSKMLEILARYRVPATWSFLRVNRSQITLDTSLHALYPQMDYFKVMRKYNRKATKRRIKAALKPDRFRGDALGVLLDLPKLTKGAIEENAFNVKWVRRRARRFQATANKATLLGRALSTFYTFSAFLIVNAGVMLLSHQNGGWLPLSPELSAWLDHVPQLPVEVWFAAAGLVGSVVLAVWRGRRALTSPDIAPSNIGR